MSDTRPELQTTRLIDAPKELVYAAWTDPEHFVKWYVPPGFSVVLCEMDVREGGMFRIHWTDKSGQVFPNRGLYTELSPPDSIVFTDAFDDDRPDNVEVEVRITLRTENGKTRMDTLSRFASAEQFEKLKAMGMEQGWSLFMDQLADYAKSMR